jgi:hypothetical protein
MGRLLIRKVQVRILPGAPALQVRGPAGLGVLIVPVMPVIPLALIGAMIARFDGPPGTRKEFARLPDLVSHVTGVETAAMTDPMTPTEERWLGPGVAGIGTAGFLATPAMRCSPPRDRQRAL